MRTSALILGIIGGIAGMLGSFFVLVFGGIGSAFDAAGSSELVWLGFFAVFFSIVGIVGGSLAIAKPKLSGILMLISGIGGIIAISFGYVFGGPLLIVGGVLALLGSRK